MLRRDLIAGLSGFAVALASGGRGGFAQVPAPKLDRILLLVELKGGNDGLNTVIPYADPVYAQARPRLAIARDKVVQLDERVGFNPALQPLMTSWAARDLAVLQGVGYPYPNRSHFRSIEIWDTASAASQTLTEGWMAQAFAGVPRGAGRRIDSIVVDTNALPATGGDLHTIVMQDAEAFIAEARAMKGMGTGSVHGNPALEHVLKVRAEVNAASVGLAERMRGAPAPGKPYAAEGFGRQLDLATRIVLARVPVVAVKVGLGSFDTHARQHETHERLLGQLADGLATFRHNMMSAGRWNDVLVLTYSEFGRRLKQNASEGTDHGAAAPQFAMGGAVKGGLHGVHPSLTDLQDGDVKHGVDFRTVFGTVARRWWGLPRDFGVRNARPLDFLA